ncbi:MAG: sulfatase-like hydrolase/transferase [Chloroflexi bacterium]|nr:sulfatase-like hydrolase/transferase [Chloroflexota bacterium]
MMPPKGLDEMQLTGGKGSRWTVAGRWRAGMEDAEESPLGPGQLGPVYAEWLERKRPGAYEQIYAQRRRPEYRDQSTAIVNCLAAEEYVDHWIGENTWNYIGRNHDRPWFAWCGFCGPHPPYDPPEPYASMYPQDEMPVPPLLRARQRNVPGADYTSRFDGENGEPLIRKIIAYYWGMMTFIDDMIGRIMDTLTRRGLWEHTLVLFTTDHGEMLGDFGKTGKGNFLERVIRVPYIVVPPTVTLPSPLVGEGPGVRAPSGVRTYDGLVEHVDLVPTVLDYAGIEQPGELPGQSLRPILEGRPADFTPKPFVICEHGSADLVHRSQCLRTDRYKYVFSTPDRRVEFYDLQEDPQELANAAGDPRHAAEIQRHAKLFIDHRLRTETNAWKCGLAAQTPSLETWGLPPRV